jgi:ADP-ribose pyrophosphatase YjhB (NUDIX family)
MSYAPKWLEWAREIDAIGQIGLAYSESPYDRERYGRLRELGAEILSTHSTLSKSEILQIAKADIGYTTPKVDLRGVVFRNEKILLIQERSDEDRWTLPGGWADVNEAPSEGVVREIREESGFEVRVVKLLAAYDRDKRGHTPPHAYHVLKLFFLCELTGGEARTSHESSGVDFFAEDAIPELSLARTTPGEIARFFEQMRHPDGPTDFD